MLIRIEDELIAARKRLVAAVRQGSIFAVMMLSPFNLARNDLLL